LVNNRGSRTWFIQNREFERELPGHNIVYTAILVKHFVRCVYTRCINKNRVLTKEAIAEHLWNDNIDLADNFDFIYTHLNNIRRKIKSKGGNDYFKTIYGMGYKFSDQ
jgi:DNA-binding response OmpR family regulator